MISICILTKNAAQTIQATLESVRSFPEVILLDNGSTDDTLKLARTFPNTRIFETAFIGFGPLRNRAAAHASHDWILALDSDEILSAPLLLELSTLTLDPTKAYSILRHNYYNGKRIRGCGWNFDRVTRLYHRNTTRFSHAQVHETLLAEQALPLSSPLFHTPYRSTADFLAKMQHYSTLFAEQHRNKKNASFSKALLHAFYAFFSSYFLKRGIFCGSAGLLISIYNANTTFYKYLKLAEVNGSLR